METNALIFLAGVVGAIITKAADLFIARIKTGASTQLTEQELVQAEGAKIREELREEITSLRSEVTALRAENAHLSQENLKLSLKVTELEDQLKRFKSGNCENCEEQISLVK